MAGEGARGDIERLTREGMAEGYRLAADAREALRSRYQDWMLVILIFALLGWGLLLVAFALSGLLSEGPGPLAASLTAIAAASIPLFLICRSRFRQRIAEQDKWMARLGGRASPTDDASLSRFELLVEVSEQVPAWLSMREGTRFQRHPFLATAMFIAGASVVVISLQAFLHRGDSSLPYLVLMLLPFLALLAWTILAQRKAVRQEREAVLSRWRERAEASRRALEELLGGP